MIYMSELAHYFEGEHKDEMIQSELEMAGSNRAEAEVAGADLFRKAMNLVRGVLGCQIFLIGTRCPASDVPWAVYVAVLLFRAVVLWCRVYVGRNLCCCCT